MASHYLSVTYSFQVMMQTTMIEGVLRKLGMPTNDAKIYLGLLEVGSMTASKLARFVHLHRANVYDSLQRLIQKGLVHVTDEKNRLYASAPPEHLRNLLSAQQMELEQLLPLLKDRFVKPQESKAVVACGAASFIAAVQEIVSSSSEVFLYGLPADLPISVRCFLERLLHEGVQIKALCPDKFMLLFSQARRTETSQVTYVIGADEVLVATWDATLLSVRIKHTQIAQSHKQIFEIMYEQ